MKLDEKVKVFENLESKHLWQKCEFFPNEDICNVFEMYFPYIIYLVMTVFYNFEAWDWDPVQILIDFCKYSRRADAEEAIQMVNQ